MGNLMAIRIVGWFALGLVVGLVTAFGVGYVQGIEQRVHNIENYLAVVSAGR